MENTTKLQRLGNSTGLALRKEILLQADLRRGDAVRLLAAPGEIRVLAVDSPLARCLRLGEALCIRHARVLRALLSEPTIPRHLLQSGPPQQAWTGAPKPVLKRDREPDRTQVPTPFHLPPVEALVSLQSGALPRLAQADDLDSAAAPDRAILTAALTAASKGSGRHDSPPRLAARLIGQICMSAPAGGQAGGALGFLAGNLVLELNGLYLDVTEGNAMAIMGQVTGSQVTAPDIPSAEEDTMLAQWLADNSHPLHRWFP